MNHGGKRIQSANVEHLEVYATLVEIPNPVGHCRTILLDTAPASFLWLVGVGAYLRENGLCPSRDFLSGNQPRPAGSLLGLKPVREVTKNLNFKGLVIGVPEFMLVGGCCPSPRRVHLKSILYAVTFHGRRANHDANEADSGLHGCGRVYDLLSVVSVAACRRERGYTQVVDEESKGWTILLAGSV
jgi:hypothetical protein